MPSAKKGSISRENQSTKCTLIRQLQQSNLFFKCPRFPQNHKISCQWTVSLNERHRTSIETYKLITNMVPNNKQNISMKTKNGAHNYRIPNTTPYGSWFSFFAVEDWSWGRKKTPNIPVDANREKISILQWLDGGCFFTTQTSFTECD